ncbi:MAG TPA: hypothetical protein VFA00_13495 [Actinomycetota bacterium]|nr:hypothetical protein [Actinomycetota bacterium]
MATRQFTKEELTCPDCGFVAGAPQGLSSHQRSNGHGPYKARAKSTRRKIGRRRKKTTVRKTAASKGTVRRKTTTRRKTSARKTTARKKTATRQTGTRGGTSRTTPLSQALRTTRRAAERERAELLDRVEQLDAVIQQIDSMNV